MRLGELPRGDRVPARSEQSERQTTQDVRVSLNLISASPPFSLPFSFRRALAATIRLTADEVDRGMTQSRSSSCPSEVLGPMQDAPHYWQGLTPPFRVRVTNPATSPSVRRARLQSPPLIAASSALRAGRTDGGGRYDDGRRMTHARCWPTMRLRVSGRGRWRLTDGGGSWWRAIRRATQPTEGGKGVAASSRPSPVAARPRPVSSGRGLIRPHRSVGCRLGASDKAWREDHSPRPNPIALRAPPARPARSAADGRSRRADWADAAGCTS